MRTVKAKTSLHTRAVSGFSLSANRIIGYYRMYKWRAYARVILCACAGWPESVHFAHAQRHLFRLMRPHKSQHITGIRQDRICRQTARSIHQVFFTHLDQMSSSLLIGQIKEAFRKNVCSSFCNKLILWVLTLPKVFGHFNSLPFLSCLQAQITKCWCV